MLGGSRGMLAAKQPLVVPMLLRLSHFKLDSYVVLVVSRQKGITLVFKTDPLQNVDINSTFDSIAVIQKFIQREIEGQLRQMFREDLPGIIHRLSQQWVKAKVEAPYLTKRPPATRQRSTAASDTGVRPYGMPPRMPPVGTHPLLARTASVAGGGVTRPRSGSGSSSVGRRPSSVISTPQQMSGYDEDDSVFGDPDSRSMFNTFKNLFTQSKGLAELAEETSDIDDAETYDSGNWEDLMPPEPSEVGEVEEYETVPAVGGGFITRPRVVHAHSQIMSPNGEPSRPPSRTASRASGPSRLSNLMTPSRSGINSPISRHLPSAVAMERAHSWAGHYNPYFAGATPMYMPPGPYYDDQLERGSSRGVSARPSPSHPSVPTLEHPYPRRLGSPSSIRTRTTDMTQPLTTPPNAPEDDGGVRINRSRRPSFSNPSDPFGSPPDPLSFSEHDPKIVLKPTLNSVSRLSLLSNSYHTLSPYTRTLEHFTVRSVPPRESTSSGSGSAAERPPVKARRKRTYFLGGKKQPPPPDPMPSYPDAESERAASPVPGLSEFDASDMERYFRSSDDLVPQYPDVHPSHIRRRSRYQQQPQQ